jgi:hypothetical protein
MSPELLNSDDEEALPLVTAASDVYALGCVGLEVHIHHCIDRVTERNYV